MKYPDIDQARAIMEKYALPDNIKEHCSEVSGNSVLIGAHIHGSGNSVDLGLVRSAGFLHDIGRVFYLAERGARPGEDYHEHGTLVLLMQEGYHDFAQLCASHPFGGLTIEETAQLGFPQPVHLMPRTLESKIVCIADKIRRELGIYTLQQKIEDYHTNPRLDARYFSKCPGLREATIERVTEMWHELESLGMRRPPISPDDNLASMWKEYEMDGLKNR